MFWWFLLVLSVFSSFDDGLIVSSSFDTRNSQHKNPNNKTEDDSWIFYSFQFFNHNDPEDPKKLTRSGSESSNPKDLTKNLTPSETLLYHGYIPPVNHLEDPPSQGLTTTTISTPLFQSDLKKQIYQNDQDQQEEDQRKQQPPGSIQDLLEPAEAEHQSQQQQTEADRNPSEYDPSEEINSPDDDEDFGPDPINDDIDDSRNQSVDSNDEGRRLYSRTLMQNDDIGTEQFSNDNNVMARRADNDDDYEFDSDSSDSDSDDAEESKSPEELEYRPIMPNDREQGDDIDQEDFGDGGETQKIDKEIIIPQIFLWNNPIESINNDEGDGSRENDFDLDESKFDKEYTSEETRMDSPFILTNSALEDSTTTTEATLSPKDTNRRN